MFKHRIFILAFVFLFFLSVFLYGDIIITKDDMILNGKILEEKKGGYLKFANYHGMFTINYNLIKEIYRTERYEDDVKILLEKGKPIDETEVKTNFQAGLEKLEQEGAGTNIINEKSAKDGTQTTQYTIFFSPFFCKNMGEFSTILPYSYGGSVIGDISFEQFKNIQKLYLKGLRAEIGYFHSEKADKRVIGTRASAGPLWRFALSIGSLRFDYSISPVIGIGWYDIKGNSEKTQAIKWNSAFITGPVFYISAIALAPLIRFDYIYDGRIPLYGIGFSLGAGFRF